MALDLYSFSHTLCMLSRFITASMALPFVCMVTLPCAVTKRCLNGFKMPKESQGLSITNVSCTAFCMIRSFVITNVSIFTTSFTWIVDFLAAQLVTITAINKTSSLFSIFRRLFFVFHGQCKAVWR